MGKSRTENEFNFRTPFWSVHNGLAAAYPRLDRNLVCVVVVVGGGITGALVSFHLAEAGVSAVLVDKRDIGTGGTSGSTGLHTSAAIKVCRSPILLWAMAVMELPMVPSPEK